ncbi:MAG: c-type cytochrome [Arcticibacter sp.]
MKKIVFLLAAAVVSACGSPSESGNNRDSVSAGDMAAATRQSEVDTNVNDIGTNRNAGAPASGSFEKGAELISSSDCLSCHKEKIKIIGPAYVDVAKKYEASDKNIDMLARKIIEGGSGVWGDIPMTPHPSISQADAKEMVRYILSLK